MDFEHLGAISLDAALWINGGWYAHHGDQKLSVDNLANETTISDITIAGTHTNDLTIQATYRTQTNGAHLPTVKRSKLSAGWANEIEHQKRFFARQTISRVACRTKASCLIYYPNLFDQYNRVCGDRWHPAYGWPKVNGGHRHRRTDARSDLQPAELREWPGHVQS